MKRFLFAFRRTSLSFALLLIALAGLLLITPLFDLLQSGGEAGFVCLSKSDEGQRIAEYLVGNGLIQFESEDDIKTAIYGQKLGCAFVIPYDLNERMERGEMAGAVKMYQSDSVLRPEMWRQQIAAAIFSEYAPYLSANALNGTDITLEQVKEKYSEMSLEGYSFVFSIERHTGEKASAVLMSERMLMFVLSLLVFLISAYEIALPTVRDSESMAKRIGAKKTVLYYSFPFLTVRCLMLTIVLCIGNILIRRPDMIVPSIIYSIAVILFVFLLKILTKRHFDSVFAVVGTLCCFAIPLICPIVFDAALFFPYIKYIRYAFVPHWLWYFI